MIKINNFKKFIIILICFILISGINFLYCPWGDYVDNILIHNYGGLPNIFKFLFFGIYDLITLVFYNHYDNASLYIFGLCIYVLALFGWISIISAKMFELSINSKVLNLIASYMIDNIMSYIISLIGFFLSPVIILLYSKILDMQFYSLLCFLLLLIICIPAGAKLFNCFVYFLLVTFSLVLYSWIHTNLSFNHILVELISICTLFICILLTTLINNFIDSIFFEKFFQVENDQEVKQFIYSLLYTSMLISFAFISQIFFTIDTQPNSSHEDLNINLSTTVLDDNYVILDILLKNPNEYAITINNQNISYDVMNLQIINSSSSSESNSIAPNGSLEYQILFQQSINYDFYIIFSIVVIVSYIIYLIVIAYFDLGSIVLIITFDILVVISGNYILSYQDAMYVDYIKNETITLNTYDYEFSYTINLQQTTEEEVTNADDSVLSNDLTIPNEPITNLDELLQITSNSLFNTLKYVIRKVITFFVIVLFIVGYIVGKFQSKNSYNDEIN